MALGSGTKLGPYEILAPLGAGGMGEVYRARDTRLDRDVAVKALPDHLAGDPDRLARFEREAKIVASLNDPGIAGVYALEESGGRKYLVMEYVAGETLAQRCKRGPLPLDEALAMAVQIARALEAAHEKGIIHRDLKPGNVMITPDGKVKVLDFGLARTAVDGPSGTGLGASPTSPTLTAAAPIHSPTIPGAIMGTAGYMSPEQARGRPVDKRSDIFSFGCVLHEMLTGAAPFGGETVADSIGAVLHKELDPTQLPPQTPATVRRLLRRCLAKDRNARLHDIADARIELEAVGLEGDLIVPPPPVTASRRFAMGGAFVGGAVLVGLAMWVWDRPGTMTTPAVTRFSLDRTHISIDAFMSMALSPDGRHLVYRAVNDDGREGLKLRSFDVPEARSLGEGAEGGWTPFFSPDGGRVGFFTRGLLKAVTLAGGLIRTIALIDRGAFAGATWLPDDTIVFASSTRQFGRVSSAGGGTEFLEVKGLREGEFVISPWALPGGEALLCGVGTGSAFDIGVYDLSDRTLTKIAENGFNPTYATSGHILYQAGPNGPLTALPFDLRRRAVTGPPFPVINELGSRVSYQVRMFAVASNGTLAYVPKTALLERGALMWVDRQGKTTPIVEVDRVVDTPRLSRDGRRLAFRAPAPNCDIWLHDMERGVTARLTREGDNHGIAWFGDDKRLAFARLTAPQLWSVMALPASGAGEVEQLTAPMFPRGFVSSLSPDERFALVNATSNTGDDVFVADLTQKNAEPLLNSRFQERAAVFSPDGRYIAYLSDESGRDEVYVQPFPLLDAREQISIDGGTDPVWSPNGKELFFRSGHKVMAVEVTLDPTFRAGRPQVLFETELSPPASSGLTSYDVSSDGQRFVMWRQRSGEGGASINVVLNWFEELRALAPRSPK